MHKITRLLAGLAGFAAVVALVVKAKRRGDVQRWVEPPADGWPPLREAPAPVSTAPTTPTAPTKAPAAKAPATKTPAKSSAGTKKTPAKTSTAQGSTAKKAPAKKASAKKAPAKKSAAKAPAKKSLAKKAGSKAMQEQLPGTGPSDAGAPAWVDPVDGACPDGYPVKAKLTSGIFHVPGGMNYPRVKPDRCFRDEAAALEAGLRPSKM